MLVCRQWQWHTFTYSIRCPLSHCNQWQTWPHFSTALLDHAGPWSCWAVPFNLPVVVGSEIYSKMFLMIDRQKTIAVKDVLEWCVIYDPGVCDSEIVSSSNFQSFWTLNWLSHWCFGNFTAYPCEWLASVFRATSRCVLSCSKTNSSTVAMISWKHCQSGAHLTG